MKNKRLRRVGRCDTTEAQLCAGIDLEFPRIERKQFQRQHLFGPTRGLLLSVLVTFAPTVGKVRVRTTPSFKSAIRTRAAQVEV